jgi:hypothetical protein
VTILFYILINKFVPLVGSGRQTCRPSRDEKGLKDWANASVVKVIILKTLIMDLQLLQSIATRATICTIHFKDLFSRLSVLVLLLVNR